MDENHQDKPESKTPATEDKLGLPPLSPKDQEKLVHLYKNQRKAIIRDRVLGEDALGLVAIADHSAHARVRRILVQFATEVTSVPKRAIGNMTVTRRLQQRTVRTMCRLH